MAKWIRRLTSNQKTAGSIPAEGFFLNTVSSSVVEQSAVIGYKFPIGHRFNPCLTDIFFIRGCSSNGRARALQARGSGIDALHLQ